MFLLGIGDRRPAAGFLFAPKFRRRGLGRTCRARQWEATGTISRIRTFPGSKRLTLTRCERARQNAPPHARKENVACCCRKRESGLIQKNQAVLLELQHDLGRGKTGSLEADITFASIFLAFSRLISVSRGCAKAGTTLESKKQTAIKGHVRDTAWQSAKCGPPLKAGLGTTWGDRRQSLVKRTFNYAEKTAKHYGKKKGRQTLRGTVRSGPDE